jgi:hypothetical protein
MAHGLAHGDGRGEHFFDRSLPSKLTKASVHGGDEVRKLTGPDCIMSQIAPDDFRREKWTNGLSIHGSLRGYFCRINMGMRRAFEKSKNTPRHHQSEACYIGPMLRWVQSSSSEGRLCRRRNLWVVDFARSASDWRTGKEVIRFARRFWPNLVPQATKAS